MDEKVGEKSRGGKRLNSGRKAGVPNKISSCVKDNVIEVFQSIGGVNNMAVWASENQTQFYNLYSKLLPLQVDANVTINPIADLLNQINGSQLKPNDNSS